jgi:transporter family-2 protein
MTSHPSAATFAALALLMVLTGFGIPVMAALNAGLGRHLASPAAATATLFGVGLVVALLVTVGLGVPAPASFRTAPPQYYLGALFVVFYIMAITYVAPRIGVANAVFFVLLGQLVAAATIDHFALLGAIRSAITLRRGFGLVLMMVGLYFARRPL